MVHRLQRARLGIEVVSVNRCFLRRNILLSGPHSANRPSCCACRPYNCALLFGFDNFRAWDDAYLQWTIKVSSGWVVIYDRRHASSTCNRAGFHFPANLESRRSVRVQYLGILRFLVGRFDRLDIDLTNVLASMRDSSSIICRGVALLIDEYCASLYNNGVPENIPIPLSTEWFLASDFFW